MPDPRDLLERGLLHAGSLANVLEELGEELRHLRRETGLSALDRGDTTVPTPSPDPRPASAAEVALAEAERQWIRHVSEPPGPNSEAIDGYIRDVDFGLGWPSADAYKKGLGPAYVANGQFAWCGAFVCWCYGSAGLDATIRRKVMPSTYRLWEWARKSGERYVSGADEVLAGDVVVVGPQDRSSASYKAWGNHVTLARGPVQRMEGRSSIPTWEGNARGLGPDGNVHEGVIRRSRPVESGRGNEYGFRFAVRFAAEDFAAEA